MLLCWSVFRSVQQQPVALSLHFLCCKCILMRVESVIYTVKHEKSKHFMQICCNWVNLWIKKSSREDIQTQQSKSMTKKKYTHIKKCNRKLACCLAFCCVKLTSLISILIVHFLSRQIMFSIHFHFPLWCNITFKNTFITIKKNKKSIKKVIEPQFNYRPIGIKSSLHIMQ